MKKKISLVILLTLIITLNLISKLPEKIFENDYSTVILDEDDKYLRVYLNSEEQWSLPPGKEILPEKLLKAAILFEDKNFYKHIGIDLKAIIRAINQNLKKGRRISGASTITMQLARLSKPKKRNLWNKGIEVLQAMKIEIKYSKEEILRMYFNHAPYGGNIIGYKAASLKYFRSIPEKLTWAQAATLAILPNSPSIINPTKNQNKLINKRNRLLKRLLKNGIIDQTTYDLAILEDIPRRRFNLDFIAPQLCDSLKRKTEDNIIKTTINKKMQLKLKDLLYYNSLKLNKKGINNVVSLVVETKTGAVKAYLASQNYYDDERNGKINGVIAKRSPGSTLKPFLYALAMDEGLITGDSLLKDIPVYYGSFSPSNANKDFYGMIKARDALIKSLNVPAVNLLSKYGLKDFYLFLKRAGISSLIKKSSYYGLSLILGGIELSPWDMASLYRGLGNYGDFSGIYVNKKNKKREEKRLISKGSSYLTLEILNKLKRPGSEYYWQKYDRKVNVSWKTGTSYGQRDAWAVGTNPEYTVIVWVGNFTGEGNYHLMGSRTAGPILFEIFNLITKKKSNFEKPSESLKKVKLCKLTGYLADEYCDSVEKEIDKNVKNLKLCPYHKKIFVNKEETEEVCSLCWKSDKKEIIRIIYPIEVIQYLKEHGHRYQALLPHKETCPSIVQKNMTFIYPKNGTKLIIPRDLNGEYQSIKAKLAHKVKGLKVFWYLDGKYLGESLKKHYKILKLEKGWHRLSVIDSNGEEKVIRFLVNKH